MFHILLLISQAEFSSKHCLCGRPTNPRDVGQLEADELPVWRNQPDAEVPPSLIGDLAGLHSAANENILCNK